MSRENDYTTGNVLDYPYHQNCYKLIGIDFSRQQIQRLYNKSILR